MKKILIFTTVIILFSLSGCMEKVEVWDSKAIDLTGEWFVRYDHNQFGEDPFGAGFTHLLTFNTVDDDNTIWVSDEGEFWDYKVKVKVDIDNLTFGSEEELTSVVDDYNIAVKIKNGKIIKDAVTQPSGYVSDSIYFEVWFEDLEGATGIANDTLFVGGFMKTGFPEDLH